MKNTIEETTRLLLQGTLTKDEADKILLSLSNVSGSLEDRLFNLANDFAVDKQGEVAVKLHGIHNGLRLQ